MALVFVNPHIQWLCFIKSSHHPHPYSKDDIQKAPILAAVGQLQFEVVQDRMKNEYGVETTLEMLPFQVARWVKGGWPAVEEAGRLFNASVVKDSWGEPVLLFKNQWNVVRRCRLITTSG